MKNALANVGIIVGVNVGADVGVDVGRSVVGRNVVGCDVGSSVHGPSQSVNTSQIRQ